jgi:hypothetical protein
MSQEFFDLLARLAPAEKRERLELAAQELDAMVLRLTAVLNGLGDSRARQDILAYLSTRALASLNGGQAEITPELIEWVLSQTNEEEIVAGLREIEATGGLELHEFIHELEQGASPRE